MMAKRQQVPQLTLTEAKRELAKLSASMASEVDPRKRVKLGRRLGFVGSCIADSKELPDLETIDDALAALNTARRHRAFTEEVNRTVAMLTRLKLETMGCTDFLVLGEQKNRVNVESACLAASGQAALDADVWVDAPKVVVPAMNQGHFFLVATGYDGRYALTLRRISAPEPVLNAPEYKHLATSSEVGLVKVEGAELRFGAPEDMANAACLTVPNGLYKVQIFLLDRSGSERFVLIASATDNPPAPLERIPQFD